MPTIKIPLSSRSYQIFIGKGILNSLGQRLKKLKLGTRCAIITDSTVGSLYAPLVQKNLAASDIHGITITVPAGENSKCPAIFESCLRQISQAGLTRDSFIIALGGGVVGDLAGFVAASFMRGIDFIQIPTTLLAMVDSSVGGKVGINLPEGKNLVGAFHQPRLVLADINTLATLTPRDFRCGFGEIIKYAAIADAPFFVWLEENIEELLNQHPAATTHAIAHCCQMKATLIAKDETEKGPRALLNFGHTLGHAIENTFGYGRYLHGEAIAIGQVWASLLSEKLCDLPSASTQRLVGLFSRVGLPTHLPLTQTQTTRLFNATILDKKSIAATPRFILLPRIGHATYGHKVPTALIKKILAKQ